MILLNVTGEQRMIVLGAIIYILLCLLMIIGLVAMIIIVLSVTKDMIKDLLKL